MTAIAEATQRAGGAVVVPTVVIVEAATGQGTRDAKVNRVLKKAIKDTCDEQVARLAAQLRHAAGMGRGAAVDAIVVATAEAGLASTVITGDPDDLRRLAARSDNVRVINYRQVPAR